MTFVEFNIYSHCKTQAKVVIILKTMSQLTVHVKRFEQMWKMIVIVTVSIQ